MKRSSIAIVLMIFLCHWPAHADTPGAHKNELDPAERKAITEGLGSSDSAVRDQTVAKLAKLVEARPAAVAVPLAWVWYEPLMGGKYYQQVADWSLKTYLARRRPLMQLRAVEGMFKARIEALLALGKNDQALMMAKSLYNFVRVRETPVAAEWIEKCLAADPKTAAQIQQFKSEQKAGMATTQPVENQSTVLKSINVDSRPYLDAITMEKGGDFNSLVRLGQLLLLADKPNEALKAFASAYQVAGEKQVPEAVEYVARAMRSQDGGIGRANAFIIAHSSPAESAEKGTDAAAK